MNRAHIHMDNYEAYLLDAVEGNLSASDRDALTAFLAAHPELNIDLDGITLFYLPEETPVVYPYKSSLKKRRGGIVLSLLSRNGWRSLAVAAALAGLMLTVWTVRYAGNQPPATVASMPEVTSTEEKTPSVDTQPAQAAPSTDTAVTKQPSTAPAPAPLRIVLPSNANIDFIAAATPAAVHEENTAAALPKQSITAIRPASPFFEKSIARYEALQPVAWPADVPHRDSAPGILQTILSNEVARSFLPEMLTASSYDEADQTRNNNTIILELPRSGKKIIDTILKND